jgi:predicted CoA-substrate-specific enzyme activase
MTTGGIDCGSKITKVVLLKDGEVIAKARAVTGFDQKAAAQKCMDDALKQAGLSLDQLDGLYSTGTGRKVVPFKAKEITEVGAAAKAAVHLYPAARTVVDVGAEEGRGIRCDETGKVIDFAINEKCAAGAGSFAEAMARALEVSVEDFGRLSLKSQKAVPMNAQCAVFAESEVVSLVHAKTSKEDISRAVHDAIASRISSMLKRVGIEREVILVGGLALNPGFVDSLKRDLEMDIHVPSEPEYAGALGAAVAARGAK